LLSQKYFESNDSTKSKVFVEEAIKIFANDEKTLKNDKFHLVYMRAKCNKVLCDYE
jgi:hypothetical protein